MREIFEVMGDEVPRLGPYHPTWTVHRYPGGQVSGMFVVPVPEGELARSIIAAISEALEGLRKPDFFYSFSTVYRAKRGLTRKQWHRVRTDYRKWRGATRIATGSFGVTRFNDLVRTALVVQQRVDAAKLFEEPAEVHLWLRWSPAHKRGNFIRGKGGIL